MNLHANAALSLKGRRELCRAVVDRDRTLTQVGVGDDATTIAFVLSRAR